MPSAHSFAVRCGAGGRGQCRSSAPRGRLVHDGAVTSAGPSAQAEWWTPSDVAAYLDVQVDTVRAARRLPCPMACSRSVRLASSLPSATHAMSR
jgi:hypothetical protein